jgi:hypothetical protein
MQHDWLGQELAIAEKLGRLGQGTTKGYHSWFLPV